MSLKVNEVAKELCESMRENNALRHRLAIEDGPQVLDPEDDTIAYTDKSGQDFFIKVEGA